MTRTDNGHHAKAEEKSATSASIVHVMHPHPPQAQQNERHHIRPRLRNAKPKTGTTAGIAQQKAEDIDDMVERTRRRMQGLGVVDSFASPVVATAAATAGTPAIWGASEQVHQRHSFGGAAAAAAESGFDSPRSTISAEGGGGGTGSGILKKREECRYQQQTLPPRGRRGDGDSSARTPDASGFLKDEVVERRVPRPEAVEAEAPRGPAATSPFLTSSVGVEGYAPGATPKGETSLASEEAKTGLTWEGAEEVDASAKPMELEDVDVTFACMSPEEYDETLRYAADEKKGCHGDRGADEKEVIRDDAQEEKEEMLASRIAKMQVGNDGDSDSDEIVIGHDAFPADDDEDDDDCVLRSTDDGLETKRNSETGGNDDDYNDDDDGSDGNGNGNCALDLLGLGPDEDDEGEGGSRISEEPPPRAFMELWRALSTWVTPEACRIVRHWRTSGAAPAADDDDDDDADMDKPNVDEGDGTTGYEMEKELYVQVDRTDVGSSRCGGLMAMLRMHLTRSLRELGVSPSGRLDHGVDDGSIDVDMEVGRRHGQRWVEERLGGLVRSFDFSRPMVDFAPSMWRAMTVVLTSIAIQGDGDGGSAMNVASASVLPESLKDVGLTIEEYRYLSSSAIPSLDKGT